jgi:recombination protein RecT
MSTAMTEPKANGLQRAQKAPTVQDLMIAHRGDIAKALPKSIGLDAERMCKLAFTEIRKNPELQQCCPKSFVGAVIQCAQVGLEPGSVLGHAYLIPFYNSKTQRKEVQFMPGYRGMVTLARRSGQVVSLHARAVYEGDAFTFEYGLVEKLEHKPVTPRKEGAQLTHVYAIAHLKDGGHQFEVMTREDVEKIKAKAKAGKFGPWVDHFEEMAKKTAIRRLFKLLPVSTEMERAVMADELHEAEVPQDNALVLDSTDYKVTELTDEEPAREPGAEG